MTKRKIIWAPLSSKNFSKITDESLRKASGDTSSNEASPLKLLEHQKIVKSYISPDTPFHGVLLYHGLGSGKTCSAISIAEGLKQERKTVVFLPGSLKDNFIHELEKCADKIYTAPRRHWVFKKYNDTTKTELDKIIPKTTLEDLEGGWVVDKTKSTNYSKLSKKFQKQIKDQIKHKISEQYSLVHYNGVNKEHLEKMKKTRILDDCLVIVDEAHNIISMMTNYINDPTNMNSHIRGRLLYELFMDAKNARFIFLSGTPVMNHPIEFSVLFNILKGKTSIFKYTITYKNEKDNAILKDYLKKFPYLEFINIYDYSKNKINIELCNTTYGFKIKDDEIMRDTKAPTNCIQWINKFKNYVISGPVSATLDNAHVDETILFPTDNAFHKSFIKGVNIINKEVFMRRIAGMISYYGDTKKNADSFPKMIYNPIDKLEMTTTQYIQYEKERLKEIIIDANNRKTKSIFEDDGKNTNTYRARSAALCNFVYPPSIDIDEKITKDNKDTLLEKMSNKFDTYLSTITNDNEAMEAIQECSPKYMLIKNRIENGEGTSVVYSHLKNREGINSMFSILNRFGWSPFNLKYDEKTKKWSLDGFIPFKSYVLYGTKDDANRELIRKIFNSEFDDLPSDLRSILPFKNNYDGKIIKSFFITASGAEGITLKNARQIHVVEHHWSEIRIDQVIGRVERMNSHVALPPEQRNVTVYKYATVFGKNLLKHIESDKKLKASFETIRSSDDVKTSDEIIIETANRKKKINEQFLDCLKSASIDCDLHKPIKCYEFENNSYHPVFEKHLENSIINKTPEIKLNKISIPEKKWIPKRFHNKEYLINPKDHKLYDITSVTSGRPKQIATYDKSKKVFSIYRN